jgi:hypothetical protein
MGGNTSQRSVMENPSFGGQLGAMNGQNPNNLMPNSARSGPTMSRDQINAMTPEQQAQRRNSLASEAQQYNAQQSAMAAKSAASGETNRMQSMNMPPPGGAGGLPPGGIQNPNIATTGNIGRGNPQDDALSAFQNKYLKGGYKWDQEGMRNAAEGETNYGFVPYMNAMQAQQTQRDNMTQFGVTSAEQARLNTHGMGIADQGSRREDLALSLGQKNNERDAAYNMKAGDRQFGLESELGRGNLARDNYANQTNRTAVNNTNLIQQEQNRISRYEAETGRTDVVGRQKLDQFANETGRLTAEGNIAYQKNQLGFENRRLGMDDSYRRDALGQEGAIARERMATDSMNQRYATFGRASAPNTRAMRSW